MVEFDWDLPYPSRRAPMLARNMVATTQPLAAQAGLRMLQQGGNAVDAAVATAIALTVVEPVSAGMGGDAFAMLWDGEQVRALNATGRTPRDWRSAPPAAEDTGGELFGWDSVTTPGTVSSWVALSQRYGRLPFAKLFEPAIEYARGGFLVSPTIARQWRGLVRLYEDYPDVQGAFFVDGKSPEAGATFRHPDQANTFEAIAESGGESFYRGEIAHRIAAHAKAAGAALSLDDLDRHTADWVEPLAVSYGDISLHEVPPNSQGLVALIALGILRHFDLSRYAVDSADSIHLQLEALKLAFGDVSAHLGDPGFMRRHPGEFLEPGYLRRRADQISMTEARFPGPGLPMGSGGTTYVAAADSAGMMVSYIQSNGRGFGSGIVVPGTGISLQNRARAFNLTPGHPNEIAASKRPYHTNAPSLITRDGKPLMALGLMGWTMQPQAHVQFITRLVDHHQNPQAVLDAPRWRLAVDEPSIVVEPGIATDVRAELARRGHDVLETERKYIPASTAFGSFMMFGAAQIIYALEDGYVGASDWRRDGQVVGY